MGNNLLPRRCAAISALLLGLALLAAWPPPASAHGGTVRVNGNFGPYHIIVVSGPAAQATDLLLTVVVTGVDTGSETLPPAIVGATVTAQLIVSPTGQVAASYVLPAEPVLANSGYYERALAIPADGAWQVAVQVTGAAGSATATFPVVLRRPAAQLAWLAWGAALLPVVVGIGLLIFLLRGLRSEPPVGELPADAE